VDSKVTSGFRPSILSASTPSAAANTRQPKLSSTSTDISRTAACILDDQYGFAVARARDLAERLVDKLALGCCADVAGQVELDRRALTRLEVDFDIAIRLFD